MECRPTKQAISKNSEPPVAGSTSNPRIREAIKHGMATVLQRYKGKLLVRYEYRDSDGPIIVLAEKLPCVSGRTDKVDFSWHKVVTAYTTRDECLGLNQPYSSFSFSISSFRFLISSFMSRMRSILASNFTSLSSFASTTSSSNI